MKKLKFYNISIDYINYLKQFEPQIPNIEYDKNNKFFCGIVLEISNFHYYAPVTSFNKQQRTNLVIFDKERPISSIRFSFMIPAFPEVLTKADFSTKPQSYKDLVNAEIKFLNRNIEKVRKKALEVYKIGINKKHPLNYACCNFKLLEEKCVLYLDSLSKDEVASTIEK